MFGESLQSWSFINFTTYVLLSSDVSAGQLQKELDPFIKEKISSEISQQSGMDQYRILLQPLLKIHLYSSNIQGDSESRGNITYVIIFSAIALLILEIAVFNYINLTLATSVTKTRELGLRRIIGARKGQIYFQYIGKAVILCMIALIAGIIISEICLPFFNDMTGISLNRLITGQPIVLLSIIGLGIIIALASGTYLASFLLRLPAVKMLGSKSMTPSKGNALKKISLTLQFSATIFLITGTLIIYNQLKYEQNENLGFNKEQLIGINMSSMDIVRNYEVLKKSLLANRHILGVAGASGIPLNSYQYSKVFRVGDSTASPVYIKIFFVTRELTNVLDLKVTEGREFSDHPVSLHNAEVMINETAVKEMELKNPLGIVLYNGWGNITGTLVGVVKNFHYKSFREKIESVIITHVDTSDLYNMVIRVTPHYITQTLKFIENEWKATNPEWPFVYHFVDEDFQYFYKMDYRTGKTMSIFALLPLLISCVGLFGLVAFMIESRNKEIGIRKVNGAGIGDIISIISGIFYKQIIISFILSVPLAYYAMNQWLRNFAYKIEIHWWVFAIAGSVTLIVASITIGFKTWQAAVKNPVDILRYE